MTDIWDEKPVTTEFYTKCHNKRKRSNFNVRTDL
jgi:hypothetical protein